METPVIPPDLKNYYEYVYEPAEDSFLMIDALETDLENINNSTPTICLEIGCGTGIVTVALAKKFGSKMIYFCTDINEMAAKASIILSGANGVLINPIITDLTSSLDFRLRGKIDIMIFNPPYVVTPDKEVGGRHLSASWAGGIKGRRVIDRILPSVADLLSPRGRFYLLTLEENNLAEIVHELSTQHLVKSTSIHRRCGSEKLTVTCFTRK